MTMPLYDYDDEDLQSVINYTYRLLNKKFKLLLMNIKNLHINLTEIIKPKLFPIHVIKKSA